MKSTEITVSELRSSLPDYLARITLLDQSFRIMKNGKPVAELRPLPGVPEDPRNRKTQLVQTGKTARDKRGALSRT